MYILDKPAWNIGWLVLCTIGITFALENIKDGIDIWLQPILILLILLAVVNSLYKLNTFFKNMQPKPEREHIYRWNGKIAKW